MLTEKQQQNLLAFLEHEKYGRILGDAIVTWKTESNPKFNNFGLVMQDSVFRPYKSGCCLLGAALVGKQGTLYNKERFYMKNEKHCNFSVNEELKKYFDLTFREVDDLYHGFDDNPKGCDVESEAFKFAFGVRGVLLEE